MHKKENFTPDEMRCRRREIINDLFCVGFSSLAIVKYLARRRELDAYGIQLARYFYWEVSE